MSASAGGSPKSKAYGVIRNLIIVSVLLGLGFVYWYFTLPTYWREEKTVDSKIDQMHEANDAKLNLETSTKQMKQWKKDVDTASFVHAILPSATRAAELDAGKEAWLARANRLVPVKRPPIVPGWQHEPLTYFPSAEPLLVTVSVDDRICSGDRPSECSKADGIYREGFRDVHPGKKTVLQDPEFGGDPNGLPGNYRALIARTCNNGACGAFEQTGFTFATCPGAGNVQLWTNGFTQVGPVSHREDYSGATGAYGFEVEINNPLAQAACAANPGATIVRIISKGGS